MYVCNMHSTIYDPAVQHKYVKIVVGQTNMLSLDKYVLTFRTKFKPHSRLPWLNADIA